MLYFDFLNDYKLLKLLKVSHSNFCDPWFKSTLHGSFIGRPLPASESESESEPCGSLRNLASKTFLKYSL